MVARPTGPRTGQGCCPLCGSGVCAVRADRAGRRGGDTQCVVWASAQGRIVRPGPRVPGVRWTALEARGVQREASVNGGGLVQDFGALSLVTPSNPVWLQSGLGGRLGPVGVRSGTRSSPSRIPG
jgi:hypothetical protein